MALSGWVGHSVKKGQAALLVTLGPREAPCTGCRGYCCCWSLSPRPGPCLLQCGCIGRYVWVGLLKSDLSENPVMLGRHPSSLFSAASSISHPTLRLQLPPLIPLRRQAPSDPVLCLR